MRPPRGPRGLIFGSVERFRARGPGWETAATARAFGCTASAWAQSCLQFGALRAVLQWLPGLGGADCVRYTDKIRASRRQTPVIPPTPESRRAAASAAAT